MALYRVLVPHIHQSGVYPEKGELIELSKDEARHRIAIGQVEGPVIEPPAPTAEPESEPAAVAAEATTEAPARRGR